MLSPAIAHDPAYVYVPDTNSNDIFVIDQHTMKVVSHLLRAATSHSTSCRPTTSRRCMSPPTSPGSGSLTPINPATGKPGRRMPIDDAYNMYFTPNGQYAIVVQEFFRRLAFYDPHRWVLHDSLTIPSCDGIDHMDFTADGTKLLASCEFANRMAIVDVATHKLLGEVPLHQVSGGMPQDVKLSPDGKVFYVADMIANGIYLIDARRSG